MDIMVDYYKILDVPQSASMNDIKKAYRSQVLRWHPDKNPENRKEAEQKFKEIVEAYKVLSDKTTRGHYDENNKDTFKGTNRTEAEKHLSVFVHNGIKIFFTGKRSSSDFSVSFFSAPKRFHHFSIMTAFINGKKITTKRHLENESKYLEVEEDGKTVSIHVNGIPVYEREISEWGYHYPNKWQLWTCERRQWADEWRQWASKWRDWAEECRDWAEARHHEEDKGYSGAYAGHGKTDASKGREEQPTSDKTFSKSGGKFPGFSMPGNGKCDLKEGHFETTKRQSQPEEESSKTDKGFFVFAKPNDKNSGMDEAFLKKHQKVHKTDEGYHSPNKSNHGFAGIGEKNSQHNEKHSKPKKGQPKSEEGQSRLAKVHHGLQKAQQGSHGHKKNPHRSKVSPTKHKILSDYDIPGENRDPYIEKQKLAKEDNTNTGENEKVLGKKELKDKTLEEKHQKVKYALVAESKKGTGLKNVRKNISVESLLDSEVLSTTCSSSLLPLKRKEIPSQTKQLYSKRSKSRTGRNRSYSSRSKSRGRKGRLCDDHSQRQMNDLPNMGYEFIPDEQTMPEDKDALQTKKKKSLPPSQEGENPLQTKKKLFKKRSHRVLSDIQSEIHPSLCEKSKFLGRNDQQQKRLITLPQPSTQLPSILGQKLPHVTH